MITLPDDLLQLADQAAKSAEQSRSAFIREALVKRLAALRRQEFETLLAEGYQEMDKSIEHLRDEAVTAQSVAAEGIWVWDEA